MKAFILIVSFFTRLPVGTLVMYTDERYKKSILFFPLVGLIIGGIIFLPSLLMGFASPLTAFLTILVYLWISGGIHLDGLADSADGLLSGRPKARILEIMKDSRIGSFGVIALILYFMAFFIAALDAPPLYLIWMPVVGKTLGFCFAGFSPYARPDQGMGYVFITEITRAKSCVYALGLFGLTFFLFGLTGIGALLLATGVGALLTLDAHKKIGGMTGDTVGLVIEVTQMAFLLAASAL